MVLGAAVAACLVALAQPSGRPPLAPLERLDPRRYELTFEVTLATISQVDAMQRRGYDLADAPICMPVIYQGPYSAVATDSLRGRLWLEGREVPAEPGRLRIDEGYPFQTRLAVIVIPPFRGMTLRWQVVSRVQAWSSRLADESAAAAIPWPREWPEEVRDGLLPQAYVESDDPMFRQAVEQASGGTLRLVPPYLAAKDLIRWSIDKIRVTGDGLRRGNVGVLHGLRMQGARDAAANGLGSPHDLVCACVAVLRAAGIPARPVIGIEDPDPRSDPDRRSRPLPVSWGEFYLPQAGWVPFDPMEMRGKVRNLDVRRAWPGLGTLDDLNRRIPLAYHFVPPASVESPQCPAVWGWDPRPGGDPGSEQMISITVKSLGRGTPDPR
jgi:transglutaminase-like putative cysteine protease